MSADGPPAIFDRRLLRRRRDRAAAGADPAGFLVAEAAVRLNERLEDVARRFEVALEIGARDGVLARALTPAAGVGWLAQAEISPVMAARAAANGRATLVADEETLPLAPASLDLVASVFALHWTNDLPGALMQIRGALKPDGLFLACMAGGETLASLRGALTGAELAVTGGAAPRVSPFADVRDLGALLQRAGFALPVADVDRVTVTYADPMAALRDLRAMGETSVLTERTRRPLRRETLARALALLAAGAGPDGRIAVRYDLLWMTGWAPHPMQPQPLRPGSATVRLADALGVPERPADATGG